MNITDIHKVASVLVPGHLEEMEKSAQSNSVQLGAIKLLKRSRNELYLSVALIAFAALGLAFSNHRIVFVIVATLGGVASFEAIKKIANNTLKLSKSPMNLHPNRMAQTNSPPVNFDNLFSKFFDSSCTMPFGSDEMIIRGDKERIIAGFLNLGTVEGWPDGGRLPTGEAFIRYMLKTFIASSRSSGRNLIALQNCLKAITLPIAGPLTQEIPRPKESRGRYDSDCSKVRDHAAGRIVGNIATQYDPSKPFFEIIVESNRRDIHGEPKPFFIRIFANQVELDKRRSRLLGVDKLPFNLASVTYFDTSLMKPQQFFEQHSNKIGPNGKRIMEALIYLQEVSLRAQYVGNCWFKQPMRCLLASLYLEMVDSHTHLTPKESWNEALAIYRQMQQHSIDFIERLANQLFMTSQMRKSFIEALHKRKANLA